MGAMRRPLFPLLLLVAASLSAVATAQTMFPRWDKDLLSSTELAGRRQKVLAKMAPHTVAILFAAPERNRNNDSDYRYRTDSNFLYLSGCDEPDSVLILAPSGFEVDGKNVTELVLVNDVDLGHETWNGYQMGPEKATQLLGVAKAVSNRRFDEVLKAIEQSGASEYRTTLPQGPTGTLTRLVSQYSEWTKDKELKSGFNSIVGRMRMVKSPAEIELMKKAATASALGHRQVMQSCRAGLHEYSLQAILEYCLTQAGCEYTGYSSIVGSGPNSCILHYESNRRTLEPGDIVCMDAAGEYHGYSADVTRSFPVNGKFSPEQRAIYNIVLKAQEAGIAACHSGKPFYGTHSAASKVLADGLMQLGIISKPSQLGAYFMHGTSHMLGLDVHDVQYADTLVPGNVLTVEPGLYIKAGSPCDKKWWNIGIRIEDDILVTEGEPVILSAAAPRKPEDVERMMNGKGLATFKLE